MSTARFLQNGLNLLNRNQRNYNDLVVDGWLGEGTFKELSKYLCLDGNSEALRKAMNVQQGSHYIDIMEKDATQERFARGWLKRVLLGYKLTVKSVKNISNQKITKTVKSEKSLNLPKSKRIVDPGDDEGKECSHTINRHTKQAIGNFRLPGVKLSGKLDYPGEKQC
jgi:hypothetical protein